MQLSLYTDGASHARGGLPGGWAWVLVNGDGPLKCGSGGLEETTNNVMELTAIRQGLMYILGGITRAPGEHHLEDLKVLDVVSDSQYALGVSSGRFQASKNMDVVKGIRDVARELGRRGIQVNWQWVRGHDGNTWNERVDGLATQAKQRIIEVVSRRRATSPSSTV